MFGFWFVCSFVCLLASTWLVGRLKKKVTLHLDFRKCSSDQEKQQQQHVNLALTIEWEIKCENNLNPSFLHSIWKHDEHRTPWLHPRQSMISVWDWRNLQIRVVNRLISQRCVTAGSCFMPLNWQHKVIKKASLQEWPLYADTHSFPLKTVWHAMSVCKCVCEYMCVWVREWETPCHMTNCQNESKAKFNQR